MTNVKPVDRTDIQLLVSFPILYDYDDTSLYVTIEFMKTEGGTMNLFLRLMFICCCGFEVEVDSLCVTKVVLYLAGM